MGSHMIPSRARLPVALVATFFASVSPIAIRAQSTAPAATQPTTSAFVSPLEDGQWTMPGKNTQLWHYSGLDQINTDNVKNLRPIFEFSLAVNRGQEAAPLAVGDTMYVVTAFPNILYALDVNKIIKQEGNPLKWKYEP